MDSAEDKSPLTQHVLARTSKVDTVWHHYLRDRMIREDPTGFFVIVPDGAEPPVPLSCPICERLHRSRDDETAYLEFQCCHLCALQWAHPRREAWNAGWRPSPEQVAGVVSERPPILVTFDID